MHKNLSRRNKAITTIAQLIRSLVTRHKKSIAEREKTQDGARKNNQTQLLNKEMPIDILRRPKWQLSQASKMASITSVQNGDSKITENKLTNGGHTSIKTLKIKLKSPSKAVKNNQEVRILNQLTIHGKS